MLHPSHTDEAPAPLPPMPDLGPVRVTPNPADPDTPLINIAKVVEMARDAGTPQGDRVYRAFVAAWDRLKDEPGREADRQFAALEQAFAAIGTGIVRGVQ